jgi:hypothetical protein
MKHLIKILFTAVFVIATTHAIMYKQWWAFGILASIAIILSVRVRSPALTVCKDRCKGSTKNGTSTKSRY